MTSKEPQGDGIVPAPMGKPYTQGYSGAGRSSLDLAMVDQAVARVRRETISSMSIVMSILLSIALLAFTNVPGVILVLWPTVATPLIACFVARLRLRYRREKKQQRGSGKGR